MKEYIVKEYETFPYRGAVYEMPELIRCKECKHARCIDENDDWWECSHDKRVMHGDGFCSWAERKEE